MLDQEEAYNLGLYNLNGTLVQKIGEGRAQAGRQYEHSLNATGLTGGLYFVRLVTGAEVKTVKMMLKR